MNYKAFAVSAFVGLSGCATATPPYVRPAEGEPTAPVMVELEGDGFGGVQLCDNNTGWKMVGEIGDGQSLHESFFLNYRVPPRSFEQVLPTGRRIKLAGAYFTNSGDPGAGYRVVTSSSCVAVVSLIPEPDQRYNAVWKLSPQGCALSVYRLVDQNGNQERVLDPTLQHGDRACH